MQCDILRGRLLRLGTLTEEDLPLVERWYSDGLFLRQLDLRAARPRTAAELCEWIKAGNGATSYLFGLRQITTDELVGWVELDGILWHAGCAWLGLAIGPGGQQGRGFGREGLQLALRYAFNELNLWRVQLSVFSYNTRAIALYESCGFVREGTQREIGCRDGARFDMHLYGLLRREWQNSESATSAE